MCPAAGTRLGPYEILAPLGAGGMGEVYKARDTRLDRTVAVKVLPPHVASSPELRQRFEREARAVSSLNHPNICTLHDIGHQDGVDFLVMEFLDGETLAVRLLRGPMPLTELLRSASQIADAMDKAHRQGLVHRDLKPGNVMLTKMGAKLMDFGLAKSMGAAAAPSNLTASPTLTSPLTAEGSIVGTFQYMAPEQLEGKEADARSDIFAFGAVLYEMATGRRAFEGKTQASLIAAILKEEPRPISEAAPLSPPALDRLVSTCLEKDPEDRRQTMHDVLLDLKWIAEGGGQARAAAPTRMRSTARERLWMSAAAVFFLASAALGWLLLGRAPADAPTVRLSLTNPLPNRDHSFGMLQISPDGRHLALLSAGKEGKRALWVRALDSTSARQIPGTEDAFAPFWSPDGTSIGFFADGKLKRVAVAGGPPQTICDAPSPAGGSWNREGTIIYAAPGTSGLFQVQASGGAPSPLTRLGPREEAHRWPHFLPDGKHFVFLGDATRTEDHFLRVGSLGSAESPNLFGAVTNAAFAPPDLLLYVRSGTLLAQRLDLVTFQPRGDPIALGEHVVEDARSHHFDFSVSSGGILIYRSADLEARLTWVDRAGERLESIGESGRFGRLRLAANGRSLVLEKFDQDGRVGDIWARDLSRGTASRVTFHPGSVFSPIWSPDGTQIVYGSGRADAPGIYRMDLTKPGSETVLLTAKGEESPTSWSPDGRLVLYTYSTRETKEDLWTAPVDGSAKAEAVLTTPFSEQGGRFSPDGRWIAYSSDESGRPEIYAQEFPAASRRIQISTGGGEDPAWRSDGREIFYVAASRRLTGVEIRSTAAGLEIGRARELFELTGGAYAPAPDGQRFLVDLRSEDPAAAPYTVVLNWTRDLPRR